MSPQFLTYPLAWLLTSLALEALNNDLMPLNSCNCCKRPRDPGYYTHPAGQPPQLGVSKPTRFMEFTIERAELTGQNLSGLSRFKRRVLLKLGILENLKAGQLIPLPDVVFLLPSAF